MEVDGALVVPKVDDGGEGDGGPALRGEAEEGQDVAVAGGLGLAVLLGGRKGECRNLGGNMDKTVDNCWTTSVTNGNTPTTVLRDKVGNIWSGRFRKRPTTAIVA